MDTERGKTFKKITAKDAFTMVEVLLVISIISVLVSVAIPSMASSIKRSREVVCLANRRNLEVVLIAAWMNDDVAGVEAEFALYGHSYTCPDEGRISYEVSEDTGEIKVYCSVHDPRQMYNMGYIRGVEKDKSDWLVGQFFDGLEDINTEEVYHYQATDAQLDALKDAGFDLDKLGATYWYYLGRNYTKGQTTDSKLGVFYWGDIDYTKLSNGTFFYSMKLSSRGNYTVWKMKATVSGGLVTLREITMMNTGDVSQQTYANAVALYEQLTKQP